MKAPRWICGCLLSLSIAIPVFAQHGGGGGGGSRGGGGTRGGVPIGAPPAGQPTLGSTSSSLPPFISGKVVLDDGTAVTEPVAIETLCLGSRRTVAYTDNHGNFSFQFGDPAAAADADVSDGGTSMMTPQRNQQTGNWRECELDAVLPGFTSQVIELASRMSGMEDSDIGSLRLHRLAEVEGSSISVTSMLAPATAKKALAKARQEEQKKQWDKAEKSLERAVHIYPKYADAWFELGRVQVIKKDPMSAKQSFQQSISADPKFVNPYDGLAQMAFESRRWSEVVDTTNKLLALNPVNFPAAYFMNGVSNFYLHNLDAGEKIVRQGIKVDDQHRLPKLQYLLGMILIEKHNYSGAEDSLKQYLQLTKQPAEIAEAQKELSAIERLSAKPAAPAVKQ